MRTALISAGLALALGGGARAQTPQTPTPNPMMAHYRAYVAADARGDYLTAHEEAIAALAAAEETRSPRIGVLATNLARLRAFRLHDLALANPPAQRALEAGGVDVAQASIMIALTQLHLRKSSYRAVTEAARVLGAQLTAASQSDGADFLFLYESAQAWGYWSLDNNRNDLAVLGYGQAAAFAERIGPDSGIERTLALTGLGAAHLYEGHYRESGEALRLAIQIATPLAPESVGRRIPPAESALLNATAWLVTLRSKLLSDDRTPVPEFPEGERSALPDALPTCRFKIINEPEVRYPAMELENLAVGTIILRYGVGEDGRFRDVQLAASAPTAVGFGPPVLQAAQSWRREYLESGPHCRKTTDDGVLNIPFRFR